MKKRGFIGIYGLACLLAFALGGCADSGILAEKMQTAAWEREVETEVIYYLLLTPYPYFELHFYFLEKILSFSQYTVFLNSSLSSGTFFHIAKCVFELQ